MRTPPTVLTILLLSLALLPSTAEAGVCNDFLSRTLKEETKSILGSFAGKLGLVNEPQENERHLRDESEFWVTITEGSAFTIDCENDLVRSLYFPTGLLLKALWDLELNGREFTLFQAEYGLYVVIDQRAVAALGPDDLYVFANSPDAYKVCVNRQGEEGSGCDVYRVLPEPSQTNWPFVHAAYSYAHVVLDEEYATWAKEGMSWIADQTMRTHESLNFSLETAEGPDLDHLCGPRAMAFYERGNRPKSQGGTAGYASVSLSLCAYRDQGNAAEPTVPKRLRLITAAIAAKRFDDLEGSAHFKRLSSASKILNTLLHITAPISAEKGCGVETTSNEMQTIGFSLNPELPLWNFGSAGGRFERSDENRTKIIYPKEEHYVISSYMHDNKKFYDIWLVNKCDMERKRPSSVYKIVIYNPILTGDYVDLFFEDLDKDYDDIYAKYGRPSDRVRERRLESGYIFRISDYREYFYWHDLLSNEFSNNDKILDILPIVDAPEGELVEYFTHLTMAAVIQTAVDTKFAGEAR